MKRLASYTISLLMLWACEKNQQKPENNSTSNTLSTTTQTEKPQVNYLEKGDEITTATQTALLQTVSKAIAEKEAHGAVEYCNLKALAIVDSLSKVHNCQIRRVSDKYRNPQDKAQNETEENALQTFLEKYQIRRVSDKYRNPQDKAQNETEEKSPSNFLGKVPKTRKIRAFHTPRR